MSMTNASNRYFQQVAGEWDALRSDYFSEGVRAAAIAHAYLRPEMIVADIGAGTGFMSAGLAPLVSKVYALDGSAAMLDVARKNLAQFENIEYRLSDGQALALEDASADAVFANMYLHHCPDPLAAIREMARLLKPGGRLIITDADTHNHTWMKEEMADEWLGFERSQIRAWFGEAGLTNLIVDCTGEDCCAESQNPELADQDGRSAKISVFVAVGTRRANMRQAVKNTYTVLAEGQGSSCCSSSSCCSDDGSASINSKAYYAPEERAAAPAEAGDFALGCGNPTAMANLQPGESVLDIGSGGGLDAFLAARKVGAQGKVIGVDMTPAMLERARNSAKKNGFENVEFRQGQAESLPLADGEVDVVMSNCVINLSEDKGQVFHEAYRVLKPGGRLEVSDIATSTTLPEKVRKEKASWSACIAGALPESEYLDLISQAGFSDIQAHRSTEHAVTDGVAVFTLLVSAHKQA